MSSETKTVDLSDVSWDELIDADYAQVRQLAKNRESVRGDQSHEEIAAGLLQSEGRTDEIPDEFRNGHDDDAAVETDDVDDADEDEDEGDQDDDADDEVQREPANAEWSIDANVLEAYFKNINVLVDECRIELGEEGLQTRAVDPASVGMIDTTLESSAFNSYEITRVDTIGVNIRRILDVLSGADADTVVEIEYDAERRNLVFEYDSHEWTMALIDPESIRSEPDLPELDLPARGTIKDGVLKRAVTFADGVADHFQVETIADGRDVGLRFSAEGQTDAYESEPGAVYVNDWGEAKSLYSLEYLKPMAKALGDQDVKFEVGEEFPIKLHGHVLVTDDDGWGDVTYMLAPRIQAE